MQIRATRRARPQKTPLLRVTLRAHTGSAACNFAKRRCGTRKGPLLPLPTLCFSPLHPPPSPSRLGGLCFPLSPFTPAQAHLPHSRTHPSPPSISNPTAVGPPRPWRVRASTTLAPRWCAPSHPLLSAAGGSEFRKRPAPRRARDHHAGGAGPHLSASRKGARDGDERLGLRALAGAPQPSTCRLGAVKAGGGGVCMRLAR
ncbi:unnamed protein product [Urochloa humidicola]